MEGQRKNGKGDHTVTGCFKYSIESISGPKKVQVVRSKGQLSPSKLGGG